MLPRLAAFIVLTVLPVTAAPEFFRLIDDFFQL